MERKDLSIMKKILLLLLLVSTTAGANAQWKIGRVKQDFRVSTKYYGGYEFPKYCLIVYSENRNGTVTIYEDGGETVNLKLGTFSNINKYIEFTGYYLADVRDPVDDYVNVRKGPGTNYPILGRLQVGDGILFKKTESNWLKVYAGNDLERWDNGYFYVGLTCLGNFYFYFLKDEIAEYDFINNSIDDKFHFIGYIYKDRVESQYAD